MHSDPVAPATIAIATILLLAKVGGEIAIRLRQPAVLGELLVGVLMGNLALLGFDGFEAWKRDEFIDMFARLGVLILLFEVGLESTVAQMMRVGVMAFVVAVIGVVVPFALGWGVGAYFLPDASGYAHAFLGAALAATSVGITARVLKDLGRSQCGEARVILGAAVIDDVLGLIVLTVVASMIGAADHGETLSHAQIAITVGKAVGFLVGAIGLGIILAPRLFALGFRLRSKGILLTFALAFCFLLSWLANALGLAAIVGAFAAGLILEEAHYVKLREREQTKLEALVAPIAALLVPVFFVLMGMRTDLTTFSRDGVLTLAAALTLVAIVGKLVCGLGVRDPTLDRLSIGIGMIPRGEVGLIFANIGLALTLKGERIIDESTFAAIFVMVIITTMITPPLLSWSLRRRETANAA